MADALGDNGTAFGELLKLSRSATVLERVYVFPSNEPELKNPVDPTAIDARKYNHLSYHRQGS